MGDDGDLWCTKCEAKVEMPIARFMVRFEVEDHTGTTVFVALECEVQKMACSIATELIGASEDNAKSAVISGFSHILQQAVDFQITINSFNMKQKTPSSFTVTRINLTHQPAKEKMPLPNGTDAKIAAMQSFYPTSSSRDILSIILSMCDDIVLDSGYRVYRNWAMGLPRGVTY
ncbi:hypothetical protein C5167_037642 [Papaver somniferum]|uniref:Replication factor A C-terminal domain-containing protein n=1 Tax=Papaver somniferum TaxID=3469 RepID=A0A4Y7IB98_PAPSO|nr:hypothetical protein C5167_037642 [Papaver somniferum]